MNNRIPNKDFLGHEIPVDDQIYVNHTNCPAGTDTRGRLSIKRVGLDSYIAHCFNCGGSGYSFTKRTHRVDDLQGYRTVPTQVAATYNYSVAIEKLPLHVVDYLRKYGVTEDEAVGPSLCYRYDPLKDALVMPYNQSRTLPHAPCQLRYMHDNGGSRYVTYRNYTDTDFSIHITGIVHRRIVIVEDMISAHRVLRDSCAEITAVALMGTSMSGKLKKWLININDPTHIMIWLDYDTAGQTAAHKMSTELKPLLKKCTIKTVVTTPQPKSCTLDIIDKTTEWMET